MTLAIGTRLASYEILALLSKGGMGEVYRARDTKLGREVAISPKPWPRTVSASSGSGARPNSSLPSTG